MSGRVSLVKISDMPFMIGHQPQSRNPDGLPDRLPFELEFDLNEGLLVQAPNVEVEENLARCYAKGSLLGTAMDDTEFGRRYALDFFNFINTNVPGLEGMRCLEIGPGRGYLMRIIAERGADIVGVEPGADHEGHWRRHGVRVIKGTFPRPSIKGPFDLIIAYGVLEHIKERADFLRSIVLHMRPGGTLVIAVPDCAPAIANSDPSMLVHEHFSYFTERTLRRTLSRAGLDVTAIQPAGYGGSLYSVATNPGAGSSLPFDPVNVAERDVASRYGLGCIEKRHKAAQLLQRAADQKKTIGIFCPGRAINILPSAGNFRFFDDDPDLARCFFPPFKNVIENRESLIASPVDELWVMSRTFGARIADELRKESRLARMDIRTVDGVFAG